MSQLTPNYNLILLDVTDPLADFRAWYNATLAIIDANLGGGGSGGHTIIDPSGTDMPSETGLQFTGNVTVTDDSVNGKTIVDIPAGSGSGHTIINPSGTSMTQRSGLKFTGSVTVTDDSVNNETIVNVSGGGGVNYSTTEQVIGTWIDNKPLYQITIPVLNPSNDSNEHLVDLTSLAIDKCPMLSGYAVRHSGNNYITYYANSIETDGWYYFKARFDNFRDSIMYTCLFRNDSIAEMSFTIQYTKTTD